MYQDKVTYKTKCMVTREREGTLSLKELKESKNALIKAFANDDDIQEITVVSTNLGYYTTYRKNFEQVEKPPLGLIPAYIWNEQYPNPTFEQVLVRHKEILAAIQRYKEKEKEIPSEWEFELNNLDNILNKDLDRTENELKRILQNDSLQKERF